MQHKANATNSNILLTMVPSLLYRGSWMNVQNVMFFTVGIRLFLKFLVVLNARNSDISEFPVVLNAAFLLAPYIITTSTILFTRYTPCSGYAKHKEGLIEQPI
jgi:hypothetical protein